MKLSIFFILVLSTAYSQERISTIEVYDQIESIESSNELNPSGVMFSSKPMTEVMTYLPGVDMVERAAPGVNTEISLRGAPSQNLKMLIDDIQFDSSTLGNLDVFMLDSFLYDSISLSKSHTNDSLVFNSGGGVISFKSIQAPHLKVKLEVGSFDLGRISISHRNQSWLVQAITSKAKNDFEFINNNGTPNVEHDDFRDHRNNAGHEKNFFKTQYAQTKEKLTHGYSLTHARLKQSLPDANNSQVNLSHLNTQITTPAYQLKLKNKYRPTLSLYQSHKEQVFIDQVGAINLVAQKFETRYRVNAYNFDCTILDFSKFSLLGAIHFNQMNYVTRNEISSTESKFGRRNTDVMLKARYINNKFFSETVLGRLESRDIKQYNLHNFSQELSFEFNHWWRIVSSFSLGQRLANFDQLYGNTGFLVGNAQLVEEEIRAFTLSNYLKFGKTIFDITFFQHDYNNLLVVYFDSRGVGKTQNADFASARGIELLFKTELLSALSGFTSITVQNVEYDKGALRGNQLPGRYAQKYSYGLEYIKNKNQVALDLQIFKDIYLDSVNLLKARDYLSLNLNYKREFAAKWAWTLSVNNLSDEPNQLINGLPTFGRNFLTGLEYRGIDF